MPFNFERIQEASTGLFYINETDSPFEALFLNASSTDLQEKLLTVSGKTADTTFSADTLPHFFRNLTKQLPEETPEQNGLRQRYERLEQVLQVELPHVAVYLVGDVEVDALILGSTGDGKYAGLRTKRIQT